MTKALRLENFFVNQKQISQSAVALSIIAHVLVVVVIKNVNFNNHIAEVAPVENYVDLGYQQFDEVPQIASSPVPQPKDVPDVVPDKSEPTPVAHEMQDQSSDVAGLQKEKPEVAQRAPATTGPVTDVPYYKVKPKYPKDALLSGVEGNVKLQIDVKEDGSVENIQVTGGENLNFFESAARNAVSKYKYKPFVDEHGNPIRKNKHSLVVNFTLKDDSTTN